MEQIIHMMDGWAPLAQEVFLLASLLGSLIFIERIAYYIVVLLRGWPRQKL